MERRNDMKTTAIMEIRERIIVSAHLKFEDAIPSLSQLIGYRQRVAQEILDKGFDESPSSKNLYELWNYANENINKILGL